MVKKHKNKVLKMDLYRCVKDMISPKEAASGPAIGAITLEIWDEALVKIKDHEQFFTSPYLQDECLQQLTMVPERQFSRYVSRLLDEIGFSYDMVKCRQQNYGDSSTPYDRDENHPIKMITTGGKGEGTRLLYEGDIDHMIVLRDVVCADYPQCFIHDDNITLFHTERNDTSPGYTTLKLLKQEGEFSDELLRPSILETGTGSKYMSSRSFTDQGKMKMTKPPDAISGPSIPLSGRYTSFDMVFSFRCFCPDILEKWLSRPRKHGWPSASIIQDISCLDGHVVPVGFKGSPDMDKEWIICFSLAELHLMRNLNGLQQKVYILLKKICKSVLNPVCKDMTSYIMKNVILWICESNDVQQFTDETLVDIFLDCIVYLQKCISEFNLPSYMIPERNLLAGRLDDQTTLHLARLLDELLQERGRMLLRCDKLRHAMLVMYKVPDMFKEYSMKRDQLESMLLYGHTVKATTMGNPRISDEMGKQILEIDKEQHQRHVDQLIGIDTQTLKSNGKTDKEIEELREAKQNQLLS